MELKGRIRKLCFGDEYGGSYSIYGNKEYYTITDSHNEFNQITFVFYDESYGDVLHHSSLSYDGGSDCSDTIKGTLILLKKFESLRKSVSNTKVEEDTKTLKGVKQKCN